MKRVFAVVLAVSLAAVSSTFPDALKKGEDRIEQLSNLYEHGRYFELRDALAAFKDDASIEAGFYRGAVDQIFNRLDSAVLRLERYLRNKGNSPIRPRSRDAQFLLADAFYRRGNYREAAEIFRQILDRYGFILDAEEKANCENQASFMAALSKIPPQSVQVEYDTTIGMTDRHFPVQVGNRTVFFEYDTGSSVSILRKSAADDLGVPIYGPPVKIQTGTGERIDGRIGVVPEMRIGFVLIRNAVFLILPDDAFLPVKSRPREIQGGLLGMPVLQAFKEFAETSDGDLVIPARPLPRTGQNMGFSGFRPFVDIPYRDTRLSLCLDSGATATVLYPPFFRLYRGEIKHRTTPRITKFDAVGGSRTVPVYVLDEFRFPVGGKDLALRRVAVHTRVTHTGSRYFHGNLGIDILPQCARMTFNFVSMSFVLE
ncbi:MAG: aspartyl protease family protein [Candidatus Aminicenantales bacterium]